MREKGRTKNWIPVWCTEKDIEITRNVASVIELGEEFKISRLRFNYKGANNRHNTANAKFKGRQKCKSKCKANTNVQANGKCKCKSNCKHTHRCKIKSKAKCIRRILPKSANSNIVGFFFETY